MSFEGIGYVSSSQIVGSRPTSGVMTQFWLGHETDRADQVICSKD